MAGMLSLGLNAKIFGLGLGHASQGLGLELKTYRSCCEICDFYPRDAVLALSLRQRRVRLSVTRRYCAQESESRIVQGMIHRKIRKGSPPMNVPNEGEVGFSAIFDQNVVIFRKQCILDRKLLQDGNRKPYASYRQASQLYSLQPHCSYINHAKRFASVARFCQRQLAFLVFNGCL